MESLLDSELGKECWILTKLAWPLVVSSASDYFGKVLTTIFAGRYLTTDEFDGVALGNTMTNIAGYCLIIACASPMDSLCTQANGAQNWKLYSLTVWRALLCTTLFMIPVVIIFLYMDSILLGCGQNPLIADYVQTWCYINVLILPAYTVRTIAARFLSSQGISQPLLYIGVVVYCIWHPALLYTIFVLCGQREFMYAPIANVVTAGLQTLCTLGYCVIKRPHHPLSLQPVSISEVIQWNTDWKQVVFVKAQQNKEFEENDTVKAKLSEEDIRNGNAYGNGVVGDGDYNAIGDHDSALTAVDTMDVVKNESVDSIDRIDGKDVNLAIVDKGMSEYFHLLMAGIFSLCAEWWSWEVITVVVGLLGPTQLAVHVIYATIIPLYYMIPMGLGLASASRIGTLIGERRFDTARRLGNAILWFSMIEGTSLAILSFFIRTWIPMLFTSNPEVIEIAAKLSPLYCLFVIPDAMQGSFQGVLRGIKRQGRSSWGVLIGPWLTSIPLSCTLAFAPAINWQIFGIWTGNNTGYWMMDGVFLYVWSSYKWDKEPEHCLDNSMDKELEPIQKCEDDHICEDTQDIMHLMGTLKMSHFSAFTAFTQRHE